MKRIERPSLAAGGSPEINLTPVLDMVFILLIFFIVTPVFVEETGVEVKKPTAASAEDLEKHSLLIAVTEEGRIMYGGPEIALNVVRALVARETQEQSMPVILFVDRKADSGLLVDVIDECKLAGAKNVSVAAEEETP